MLKPVAAIRRPRRSGATIAVAIGLLALLVYGEVRPASAAVSVGTSGGGFLNFEVGGRSAGMGGAQVSTATGVTAQFWNPAGLATTDQAQVGAMHATWLDNLAYEWVGYARPIGSGLGVGSLSVAYFHMPGIQGVDEFDNPTQTFRVYDLAVTAGLARPMSRNLSLGANARLIRQNLATVSATGVALDFGAMGTFGATNVAAVVQNLGPSLSYDGSSYPLPRQIRLGASHRLLQEKLLLAADYTIPRDYFKDARLGAEYRAHPLVSLRLGYRKVLGSSGDPATGLSYGLGLHVKQMSVDYAMTPSDGFDNVHRFALGYSFGSGAEESEVKPAPPKKEKPLPPPPPTGPPSIASTSKPKRDPKPAEPVRVLAQTPELSVAKPVVAPVTETSKSEPVAVAVVLAPAKSPVQEEPKAKEVKAAKPVKQVTEFAIVLPGYQSMDGARSELKALQLLGFRVKDATIALNESGSFSIRLTQMKSKTSADEMATSLARMSFRAVVQTVQR